MSIFRSFVLFAAVALLASAQSDKGTVAGTVFDANTGQPVRGARVAVAGQPAVALTTDVDGKYKVDLAPGKYKVLFTADNYADTSVDEVQVTAGEIVEASTVMANKSAVTTVDVVEKVGAVAATAEAMLAERKLSAVVSDAISGDEIRKTVASDAAGAIEKVTGVSIVDSGYVYVRGLGERYSATMLNNAILPSTEPERRVVPLDLFPASLIDSIKVLKTYTPDLPGEFSGGLVQMQTVEFPAQKILRVGMSIGYNTRTTRKPFQSYPGGGTDAFGFDDGTRGIPSIIPTDNRIFPGRFSPEQLQTFGRSFSNNWEPRINDSMRPTQSYNVVAGNTFGKFGVVAAATFANTPQRFQELQRFLTTSGGRPLLFSDYPEYIADSESVKLGAVFNAAWKVSSNNKIVFRNTLTRDTDKEGRTFQGLNGGIDGVIQAQRLRWIERGLFATGVEGEHSLPSWGNSLVRWQFTYSSSSRNEPDLRETIRSQDLNGRFIFTALPQSGFRFFNDLQDKIYEPQAEFAKPFFAGKFSGLFKVGFRGTFRERDFNSRRFRFNIQRTDPVLFARPTNEIFAPANINPTASGFQLLEVTRGTDRYSANMDVYGGFAMVDINLTPKLRLVGGLRIEDADINVTTIDPLIPGAVPSRSSLVNRDALPGVNLIYALSPRQNLRFSYGRTVSRPDFRELSPFEFLNVLGGYSVAGNPLLKRAKIDNFDGRWEWFLGGDQVLAASYFYKDFTDPIEVFLQPTTGDLRQSFVNATGARNQGVELELRRGLGVIGKPFRPFALQANFTFVDSKVQLGDSDPFLALLTSRDRALMGQSRYIYNVMLDWVRPQWRSNARFLANSVSRRITDVGAISLPDIYQERNTFLDFIYQYDILENGKWSLRFTAENLGDNNYRWTQGDFLVRQYRLGRTFSIGTSFSIF